MGIRQALFRDQSKFAWHSAEGTDDEGFQFDGADDLFFVGQDGAVEFGSQGEVAHLGHSRDGILDNRAVGREGAACVGLGFRERSTLGRRVGHARSDLDDPETAFGEPGPDGKGRHRQYGEGGEQ